MTGTSASPSFLAPSTRPWPAMMLPFSVTRIGLVQPHSRIDAAIWLTCSSLWVRALRAYGISLVIGKPSTLSRGHVLVGDCRAATRLVPIERPARSDLRAVRWCSLGCVVLGMLPAHNDPFDGRDRLRLLLELSGLLRQPEQGVEIPAVSLQRADD